MRGEYASEGANSLPHAQRYPPSTAAPPRVPFRLARTAAARGGNPAPPALGRPQPPPHSNAGVWRYEVARSRGGQVLVCHARAAAAHAARHAPPAWGSRPSRARPFSPLPCSNAGVGRHEVARSNGGQPRWGMQRAAAACAAHHAPPAAGMPPSRPPPPAPPPCSDVGVGRHGGVRSGVGEVSVRDARAARHAPPATEIPHSPLHRPHRRPALQRELGGMRGARSDDGRAPALRRPSSDLAAAYCRTHRAHADGATPPPSRKH
ncbi:hypothetical protein B0H14DRAFT_2613217 [Mycena olivaceomarginata]|nr:hypothetical protein B0H14DRAFT_2613217 [Mycena olivaceomarginata]